ncbi:MAG TPA: IS110 family transposase [Ktedonobacteraceae bacterium]|nr:IS110 family transposase [Ktedonobacteraceae bacterium]
MLSCLATIKGNGSSNGNDNGNKCNCNNRLRREVSTMGGIQVVYERCCGLDIHKRTVVACMIVPVPTSTPAPNGQPPKPQKEIKSFGTMTQDLLQLSDWLLTNRVTHVAMESTGVFWKPIYNLLEGQFDLLLVNPQHIKAVPGRKTDVRDCEWIADLLRHGLLAGSFVPDQGQRELRELTRYRTQLIRERASEVNRIQKTLEGANIKLASVATDITGVSGRQILSALIGGETDTRLMAHLAKGRMREKIPQLEAALKGRFGGHQRFMLAHQLAHIDFMDASIEELNQQIEERMAPFQWALDLLVTIRGVGQRTAEVIIAEIGVDMERFPTSRHLASWAGMCPGNHESAGKRKSGRTRKGNVWLRTALVEAAQAAGRCKGSKESYLSAQYRRIARSGGSNKAAVAVGHSILVIAYEMLKHQTTYNDLGNGYFDERDRQAKERRLIQRLERLGYRVSLEPIPSAA